MQKTLSFTLDKKKYVSNIFDFEAFCKINDNHLKDENISIYRCCKEALEYMFEGTEATEDILKKVSPAIMVKQCRKLWDMYLEAVKEASKNE